MDNIITIPNIEEYTQQIIKGNLILTRIEPTITETLLFEKCLRCSSILECKINNDILDKKIYNKYKKILIYLYSKIDKQTIIDKTTLNISTDKLHSKGFEYYDILQLSIQGVESKRTLKEIINFIKILNYKMEIKIKLKDDTLIKFIL